MPMHIQVSLEDFLLVRKIFRLACPEIDLKVKE